MSLNAEVALVTGASSGIGRACAVALAERGWMVVAAGRDYARLAQTLRQCEAAGRPGEQLVFAMEDVAAIRHAVNIVESEIGLIGALVNSAGIDNGRPFLEVEETDWDSCFNTNVKGAFFCAQEVARAMLPRRNGAIVNISSVAAFSSFHAPYGPSKWALEGVTKTLAAALTPFGIRVNAVAPGVTMTAMTSQESLELEASDVIPMGRWARPHEVAAAVTFLISADSSYVAGSTLVIDGGYLSGLKA